MSLNRYSPRGSFRECHQYEPNKQSEYENTGRTPLLVNRCFFIGASCKGKMSGHTHKNCKMAPGSAEIVPGTAGDASHQFFLKKVSIK